jgi:hypothetical protein
MTRRFWMVILGMLLGLLITPAQSHPQAAPATDIYELTWLTWDVGGGTLDSSDGVYSLSATAGQYDGGSQTNGYTLDGGFWYGADRNHSLFLPAIVR